MIKSLLKNMVENLAKKSGIDERKYLPPQNIKGRSKKKRINQEIARRTCKIVFVHPVEPAELYFRPGRSCKTVFVFPGQKPGQKSGRKSGQKSGQNLGAGGAEIFSSVYAIIRKPTVL